MGALWSDVFRELQGLVAATYACSREEPLASALPLRAALVAAVMECGTAVILARRQDRLQFTETPRRPLDALRSFSRILFIARRGRHLSKDVHDALDAQAMRVERPLRLIQAELFLGAGERGDAGAV